MNALKQIKRIIRDFGKYIRLLPLKRKVMILSILMIGVNYYTAPFGMGLLAIYTLYEIRQNANNNDSRRSFRQIVRESLFLIPGSILVVSAFTGALYHGNYLNSLLAVFILGPIVFVATSIQFLWTREDGLHFARYSVMLILPVSVYAALFPWPGVFFIFAKDNARLMGTFANPNYFSYILEIFLIVAFAVVYHTWNKNTRIRIFISAAAGMICLYFTGSRTGLVAFFIGLAVFIFAMSEKKLVCALLLLTFVMFILAALFPDQVVKITAGIFPRAYTFTQGLENRFELWNVALRQINKDPFIGTGLFTYHRYIPVNAPKSIVNAFHAHNIFINFWLETGLPGVVSFIWIMIAVARRAASSLSGSPFKPYLAASLSILVITTVHGMTDAPLVSAQTIAFFGMFLAIAVTGKETARSK